MAEEPAFKKVTGIRHFVAAAGYSWAGFLRVCQESAFRQEVIALAAGLIFFSFLHAPVTDYLIFVILMLVTFAVEAINTAIEEIVDRVSPEVSNVGKNAKDLGSFAVACLLAANGAFAAFVAYNHLIV